MAWVDRFLGIATVAALAACGGDDGTASDDAGTGPRDATVLESAVELDAGGGADAGAMDAGPGAADAADGLDSGAPACSTFPCDPLVPDSCGMIGTCVLDVDGPRCASTLGGRLEGASCERSTDCAVGLACLLTRDGPSCGRICCPGDSAACDEGDRCRPEALLVGEGTTSWGWCVPELCDLLDPEGTCEVEEACYIDPASSATVCRTAGTASVGDPCTQQNDCAPGHACTGVTSPTCRRVCALSGPPGCGGVDGRCVMLAWSPEGTGVCMPDPITP